MLCIKVELYLQKKKGGTGRIFSEEETCYVNFKNAEMTGLSCMCRSDAIAAQPIEAAWNWYLEAAGLKLSAAGGHCSIGKKVNIVLPAITGGIDQKKIWQADYTRQLKDLLV